MHDAGEPLLLSDRFTAALCYAAELHRSQARKGTRIPYLSHLLAVGSLVLEHGGTEDEAIAALLHDAVEDQGGAATGEEIRRRFGDAVYAIVQGCTDTDITPKPPWRARKEAYLARLGRASDSVLLVSAADKLHNARTVLEAYRSCGEQVWERFRGGKVGTLWYYHALIGVFQSAASSARTVAIVEEFARVVTALEERTLASSGR